ncbi:hypothetical protein DAEQUDRAFT_734006 [Daedalea quercina L-15889]|uniref:Uncharacterized protein n=1 Tax=Daedalea quercina L-15889 TaxID=1314783 RepID=A0A165KL50_9APHY|nr:hypothetical protein DAEQUDRAFT_734006 [Daedalea quercina L-15889]
MSSPTPLCLDNHGSIFLSGNPVVSLHMRVLCVELRLFQVLHDGIGLILTCYGLVFYVATYYIHSLQT